MLACWWTSIVVCSCHKEFVVTRKSSLPLVPAAMGNLPSWNVAHGDPNSIPLCTATMSYLHRVKFVISWSLSHILLAKSLMCPGAYILLIKVGATIPFTSQVYTLSTWAGLCTKIILLIAISTNHMSIWCTQYHVGNRKNCLTRKRNYEFYFRHHLSQY